MISEKNPDWFASSAYELLKWEFPEFIKCGPEKSKRLSASSYLIVYFILLDVQWFIYNLLASEFTTRMRLTRKDLKQHLDLGLAKTHAMNSKLGNSFNMSLLQRWSSNPFFDDANNILWYYKFWFIYLAYSWNFDPSLNFKSDPLWSLSQNNM